jgi:uncharacterized protein (UPF0333 family)
MKKYSQKGFAHLGILLLAVVVVAVALIGYKVAKNHQNTIASTSTATSAAQTIPTIKTTADLNKVQSTLNNENVDGDLSPSSLNQDVNSLL